MSELNKEQILDAVAQMSVMDVCELIEMMEEKFGVTAAAPTAAAAPAGEAAAAVEQTEFNAMLTSFGSTKIAVIKVVRALTGLGLKEAKDLVESAPSAIKEGVSKADADDIKKKVEEAGGTVEIK